MGEQRQEGLGNLSRTRVTVREAAQRLGITPEGVRKRIERGTVDHARDENGRVYVLLDESNTTSRTESGEVIADLREQVHYLRELLEEERQARIEEQKRHDTLMAQLMQRIPELEPPAREKPSASPESPGAGPEKDRTVATDEEPTRGPERSWWRRLFGA